MSALYDEDSIDVIEKFYDGDITSIADAMLATVDDRNFHDYWRTDDLLAAREYSLRAGTLVVGPPSPVEEGELRPIYLGLSRPSDHQDWTSKDFGKSFHQGSRQYYTTSNSLGPSLAWNDSRALGELKALLVYCHRVAVVDPFDDFIDELVRTKLLEEGYFADAQAREYSVLERVYQIRDGLADAKLNSQAKFFLAAAITRMVFAYARLGPLARAGCVQMIARPKAASLAAVRADLVQELGLKKNIGLDGIKRRSVRALLQARLIAASEEQLDAYSPSQAELDEVARRLKGNRSLGEPDLLIRLASARLPAIERLSVRDMVSIREDGDFTEWRAILRKVLSHIGKEGADRFLLNEEIAAVERQLQDRWIPKLSARLVGFTVALAAGGAVSTGSTSGAVIGGLAGIGSTLATEATTEYARKKNIRRHLVALQGVKSESLVEVKYDTPIWFTRRR